jgi:hypothetical protein
MARAAKLAGYAEANTAKAADAHAAAAAIADRIPFGQPILVGHHSEKGARRDAAKIHNGMLKSYEASQKAEAQAASAKEIEAQAKAAIYSDDPDAIEALAAKIAGMEQQREQMKLANAEWLKANKAAAKEMGAFEKDRARPYPGYALTNLGGNISRSKQRLEGLKREKTQGPRDRLISARFASQCEDCGAAIEKGQTIKYNRQQGARCQCCEIEG